MSPGEDLVGYLAGLAQAPLGGESGLRDRCRGALLGLAAGNALGLPFEGATPEEIAARRPGGVRDVDPDEIGAPWDDDLAQAALLAEALVEREGLDPDDLARRFLSWRSENGRGIGALTNEVLDALVAGVPARDAARRVWEASGRKAAGNGAVARCAPVAVRFHREPRRLVLESVLSAQITHADPRCNWSVVALNSALLTALAGRRFEPQTLAERLAATGASRAVVEAVAHAGKGFLEALDLAESGRIGYTVKALAVGLWCLRRGEDFADTLAAVVSAGGDTDTNAAVAGATLGATFGASSIPERWLNGIADVERIAELAERLFDKAKAAASQGA